MTNCIRAAALRDACRVAEIEVFNYRLSFYPVFKKDAFYFGELRVDALMRSFQPERTFVYDDGAVKGFLRVRGSEIEKLFVEPVLQGRGIGGVLLEYAAGSLGASSLWALEKNSRALSFYRRHGFLPTGERRREEGTAEYLIRLVRQEAV